MHTTTQNLADEPTLANGPPTQYQSRDAFNSSTQNLADNPTLANGSPSTRGEMTCNTTTQNSADEPTLADGPPSTRGEMTYIPLHKTWQMNLLWPMDPPVPEQR